MNLLGTALAAIFVSGWVTPDLSAQTWQASDLGVQSGASGSTTEVNFHTLSLSGAGKGLGDTNPGFHFASKTTAGNVEVDARLISFEGGASAETGVMLRQSLASNAAFAFVGLNSEGELRFVWRAKDGADVAISLGTYVPLEGHIWLKLVRSGSSVAGYYSTNGINWETVGAANVEMSGLLKAGVMVTSGHSSELESAEYDHAMVVENVPQRITYPGDESPAVPVLWLRADWDVSFDENGRVSKWDDFSGYANDAIGTSSANDNRPLIVADAMGIKPALSFDNAGLASLAHRKFLSIASHASLNPEETISIFVVSKWDATPVGTAGILSKGGSSSGYTLGFNAGIPRLHLPANVEPFGRILDVNETYLMEGIFDKVDPNKGLRIYANGQRSPLPLAQRAADVEANTTAPLFIGQYLTVPTALNPTAAQVHPFAGEIAEVLIFNSAVTEAQRLQIEAYFKAKYQISDLPNTKAASPTINLPAGIYQDGQQLTLTGVPGTFVYYQINGGTPQLYTEGIQLLAGANLVTAWSKRPGFADSDPVSVTLIVDPQTNYVTRPGLKLWLRADAGVQLDGSSVESWRSQVSTLIAQSGTAGRPSILASDAGINGRPTLRFDKDYLKITAPAGSPLAVNKHTVCVVVRASNETPFAAVPTGAMSTFLSRITTTNGYLFGLKGTPGPTSDEHHLQFRSRMLLNPQTTGMEKLTPETAYFKTSEWKALVSLFDQETQSLQVNGKQLANAARTVGVGDSGTDLFIGAQSLSGRAATNPFYGDIAEILIYDRNLDDQEMRELGVYLNLRYQIPATDLRPVVDLKVAPAAGLYPVAPAVECTSIDGANITYQVNDGPLQAYTGSIDLAHFQGVVPVANVTRFTVKIYAEKAGFAPASPITRIYFVDQAVSEIPKEHMKLWLRADIGAGPAEAPERLVTNWADQSGNGNNLKTPEAGVIKPKKIITSSNGKASISFVPTDTSTVSQMVATVANNQGLQLGSIPNNDITVFAVVKDNGSLGDAVIAEQESESDSVGFSLRLDKETSGMSAESRMNVSVIKASASESTYLLPSGKFNLIMQRAFPGNPTKHILNVNKTATKTQENYAVDSSTAARLFSLGARRNANVQDPAIPASMPTNGLKGEIAELIIFDTALTDQEISQVESYLIVRYGLNSNPGVPLPALAAPEATPDNGLHGSGTIVTASHIEGDAVNLEYRYAWGATIPPATPWNEYYDGFTLDGIGPCQIEIRASKAGYASAVKAFHLTIDPQVKDIPREDLVVWLAADSEMETRAIVNKPSRITRWKDLSGKGNDAIPVNTVNEPEVLDSTVMEYNETDPEGTRIKAPVVKFTQMRRLKIPGIQDVSGSFFVVTRANGVQFDRVIMQKLQAGTNGSAGGWTLSFQDPGKVGLGPLTPFANPPVITGSMSTKTMMISGVVGGGLEVLGKAKSEATASWSGGAAGGDLFIGGSEAFQFSGQNLSGSKNIFYITPNDMLRLAPQMILGGGKSGILTNKRIESIVDTTTVETNLQLAEHYTGTFNATSYMNGEIAEILMYSSYLNQADTKAVQSYLINKYYILSKPVLDAPLIQVENTDNSAGGVFTSGKTVNITAQEGTTLVYVVNGTSFQSVTGSAVVAVGLAPGETYKKCEIKAWCLKTGYTGSAESHATVIIDPEANLVTKDSLKLWVRGDSAVTLSPSSTSLLRWIDLSGHGHHLTKAKVAAIQSPIKMETDSESVFNGHEVVKFTKALKTCLEGSYPGLNGESISVFAVLRQPASTSPDVSVIAEKFTSPSAGYTMQLINNTTPQLNFRIRTTTLSHPFTDPGRPALFAGGSHGGRNMDILFQGNAVKSKEFTGQTTVTSSANPLYVGGRKATAYFDGEIAELWVYDKKLSQEEINKLSVYAYHRYGIFSDKQVPSPVANYQGGTYSAPLGVKVTCSMADVAIHYELGEVGETDVPDPTASSPQLYPGDITGIIPMNGSLRVLKVFARKNGFVDSPVSTWTYRIEPDKLIVRRGLVSWLKGDRGVLADSEMKVSRWIDQSGMANDATSVSTGTRPLYVTDPPDANGLAVVRFNASGGQSPLTLHIPHPVRFPDERTNFESMSVIAVVRKLGTNNGLVVKKGGYQLRLAGTALVPIAAMSINSPVTAIPIRQNIFETIAGTYDRITRVISNGDTLKAVAGTAAITQDSTPKPIYIGSNLTTNSANNLQGEIAELLIYNTGLSQAERQQTEQYLRNQYGIYNPLLLTVASPQFVPGVVDGSFSLEAPSKVALIGPQDAAIYYTTDPDLEEHPATTTWIPYTQPIYIGHTTKIFAFSRKNGLQPMNSEVIHTTFLLDGEKYPAPTFDSEDETPPTIILEKPTNAVPVTP